jgi:hypothetical protein
MESEIVYKNTQSPVEKLGENKLEAPVHSSQTHQTTQAYLHHPTIKRSYACISNTSNLSKPLKIYNMKVTSTVLAVLFVAATSVFADSCNRGGVYCGSSLLRKGKEGLPPNHDIFVKVD